MNGREKLIEAARELFATKGYDATSPREIMERAKAGQGSFYHHFRSKEGLAHEVLGVVADEMLGVGRRQFDPAREPEDRVDAYLLADRDALRGCRLGRFAYDAGLDEAGLRERTAAYFREIEALLIAAFREGRPRRGARPDDLAATTLAVVQGGYVLSRIHDDPAYLRRAVDGLLTLLAH